jgi:deazaflavin-dependent oxidoreductase (nitroreductase family)
VKVALLLAGGVISSVIAVALFERVAPRRLVRAYQKFLGNPLFRPSAGFVPGWALVETVGRRSGVPRRVPVGGKLRAGSFWLVAGAGRESQFVRNIEADPKVCIRVHGRWRLGVAHVLDGDDPRRRLLRLNPINSLFVWLAATGPLTIRIDLEPRG